ncbi:MAG: Re/Si-specific NAD(P)(+) transhydrogenase subunit alpha [Planctomycetota bacterium]|jgi:NAD(P) transhydrogenase subunit alpha
MKVGIPREVHPEEKRVAGTPRTVQRLRKLGFEIVVERDAGRDAGFSNGSYVEAGATIVEGDAAYTTVDVVLKVREPMPHPDLGVHEADLIKEGATLIGFIWPAQHQEMIEKLASRNITTIAMDQVPRISRAQKMDALSAMANLAGYRAVVEAANAYPRLMSGQATAAGRVPPAKVLVIGGGVAGLAAIGAARGLGAIVRAFDTRPEVKEQVESMGGEFLELDFAEEGAGQGGYAKVMSDEFIKAEMELFAKQAMEVDIIITTALIPGKEAPKLITAGMVESMREGSVIVDLAAQQGGNCTLTEPGMLVERHSVSIVGYTDLPSRMAIQSSWLYASTLVNMLEHMGDAETFTVDLDDKVVRGALVTHGGEITWPPPTEQPKSVDLERPMPEPTTPVDGEREARRRKAIWSTIGMILTGLALLGIGMKAPESFVRHFTVFILSIFIGWQVIWNVKPALHTPLMSVTNAISGVIILGGMLHVSGEPGSLSTILGAVAVFVAMINISGGFLVTQRMLAMFSK